MVRVDGIHLTVTGEDAYARFVMSKVTIPAPPRATTTTTPTAR